VILPPLVFPGVIHKAFHASVYITAVKSFMLQVTKVDYINFFCKFTYNFCKLGRFDIMNNFDSAIKGFSLQKE